MTIPETLINKIHVGDCIAGMQELPSECANLIIADPPYNLSKDYGKIAPMVSRSKRDEGQLTTG